MDNTTIEMDPWANMGNLGPDSRNNPNAANLENAQKWTGEMATAPAFGSETLAETSTTTSAEIPATTPETADPTEKRDETIAEAEAILIQGPINAAARKYGVDTVVESIKNFVYEGQGDPIKQLLAECDINNQKEAKDVVEESRAIKPEEDNFRTENINTPTATLKSLEGALSAIEEFKDLTRYTESAPEYAELRARALKNGRTIWGEAINEYNVRDLTTLFDALSKQKQAIAQEETEQESDPQESTPKGSKPQEGQESEPQEGQESKPLEEQGSRSLETPENILFEEAPQAAIPQTPKPESINGNQIVNQSSTTNSSPETDPTAIKGFWEQ